MALKLEARRRCGNNTPSSGPDRPFYELSLPENNKLEYTVVIQALKQMQRPVKQRP